MVLKLGVTTYNHLWRCTLEETFERIARMKFQEIELMTSPPHAWPKDLDENNRREIVDLLSSYNLHIRALNPTFGDINLASPRATFRRLALEELNEHIELARRIDADIVTIVPGRRPFVGTPPMLTAWNQAKEGIIECAKSAEDNGLVVGLEYAPYFFMEKGEQLKKMIEEVGSESVKAVFDTSNSSVIEAPISVIETLGELIIHVHLADNDGKTWRKLPVGMGIIDFASVARALEKCRFTGISMIEIWQPEDRDVDAPIAASKEKLESFGWHA